ncbi:MMPL family transporter [Sanguibacter massiliensis]|uniref:MMPL family transporter n=1 Tax=Sanguibacter massiliensis TaxID=1973217 RepID=UPI001A938B44|nr:MMPL family transporter [Sanguibacter massiliensis]
MSSFLYRLGRSMVRHRRAAVAVVLALLVALGAAAGFLQKGMDNSVSIPGTESQAALDRLAATFPEVSGSSAQILVVSPEGTSVRDEGVADAVRATTDALAARDDVRGVQSPFTDTLTGDPVAAADADGLSDDDRAALVTVMMNGAGTEIPTEVKDEIADIVADLSTALPDGWTASVGGELYSSEFPAITVTEALGVGVALVVLVLTLGSLVAAGLPLANALVGVGLAMALVLLATAVTPVNSSTPMLALMLGLAVGIDYALFIVARHRDQLRDGLDVEESIARATATSGSAVLFAGLTVMIALVGLGVAGIPFLTTMGVAGAVAVAVAVVVSVTLTPALLGFAGERVRPRPSRRARRAEARAAAHAAQGTAAQGPSALDPAVQAAPDAAPAPAGTAPAPDAAASRGAHTEAPRTRADRFFAGWVHTVTRRPLVTIAAVLAVGTFLALPALDLRLALPNAGVLPESSQARQTYDRITEHYGDGANGPLIVTASILTSDNPLGLAEDIAAEMRALPGVANVPLSTPNASADTLIVQVVPEGGPTDEATADLVQEIRDQRDRLAAEYDIDIAVTGFTAVGIDVSAKLGSALLPFGIFVVGLSLVLLTMVFRSIAVPLKATFGYLLSVVAAFGVVAAVFENGIAADLLHVAKLGPVISFMPIVLMGVLFGLAMDYEVFLVSRIREEYVHGGDARAAIHSGFRGSAQVVTAAAVIMFSVFFFFVPEGDVNIKPIALGLAVGVFVDAFLVRMTLVPAVLELLGDKAWWMPRWLDRLLPSFDVEGEGLHAELALEGWPAAGTAIAARGLRVDERARLAPDVALDVPDGGVLVVDGPARAVTGLLLTLAGRVAPAGGDLKVGGLALPHRAGAVRRRVGWVDSRHADARAVEAALRENPYVLVVDAAHHLHGSARAGAALTAAQAAGTTLVLGTSGADVLPPGVTPTHRLSLTTIDAPTATSPAAAGALR